MPVRCAPPVNSPRRLAEEGIAALQDAVVRAMQRTQEYVSANQERLADIYVGRDPGGTLYLPDGGIPFDVYMDATRAQHWRVPDTGANLLMSRLQQVFVASTPGRPIFTIEPKTPGAQAVAESQELVTDIVLDGSGTLEAVRRAAWLDPIQNHVGVRLCENSHSRDATDKVKWEVIEATDCGVEPFSRRFKWHGRVCQWGSLPKELRERAIALKPPGDANPNPWDAVALTEVFDEAFAIEGDDDKRKGCRVHVFINFAGKFYRDRRAKRPDVGEYLVTHDLYCCPLDVTANLESAPAEDVSPAEAAAWIPILNMIQNVVVQIERECSATNSINVYDADNIPQEIMKAVLTQPPGKRVWVPVSGVGGSPQGISHRMRPIERDSILGELITSLQAYLALLDDVTGVGPQDRGVSINPSKSATEAGVLSASSSRRTAARLRTQSKRWENMARILFEYQKEYFGDYIDVPLDGVTRKVKIPDPKTCRFAFRISLDEMENLSRRGRLDTLMMTHTVLTRHAATFPNGESMLVAESLRRLLKSMGWVDADAYTTERRQLGSPEDRYTKMLETGRDYVVSESDDPMPHIAFLGAKMAEAVATGNDNIPVDKVAQAAQKMLVILRQREAQAAVQSANPSTIPGVSAQGTVDNGIAAQLQAGLPPEMSSQILGQ